MFNYFCIVFLTSKKILDAKNGRFRHQILLHIRHFSTFHFISLHFVAAKNGLQLRSDFFLTPMGRGLWDRKNMIQKYLSVYGSIFFCVGCSSVCLHRTVRPASCIRVVGQASHDRISCPVPCHGCK